MMELPQKTISYAAIPTELYEAMKAVIVAVTESDQSGFVVCSFCEGTRDWSLDSTDQIKHEDQCVILKARQLAGRWTE